MNPILFAITPLSGCATIIEGTTQEITVVTDPPGAACALTREGELIGMISMTPGTVKVDKTKHDISISCRKTGYDTASSLDQSDFAAASLGNTAASIVVGRIVTGGLGGGLIGHAIDSISGADNKYDSTVNIKLVRSQQLTPPMLPAPAAKAAH